MNKERAQFNNLYLVLDIAVIVVSYILSWALFIVLRVDSNIGVLSGEIYFTALLAIIPIYLAFYTFFGIYNQDRIESTVTYFYRLLEASIMSTLIITLILFIGRKNPYLQNFSTVMILAFCGLNFILTLITRFVTKLIIKAIRKKGFNQKHILLVGYSDATFRFIDKVSRNPGWGYKIHGIIDDNKKIGDDYRQVEILDRIKNLEKIIENNSFDEVVITLSLDEYEKLRDIVKVCEKTGVHTMFVPDYGTMIPTKPVSEDLDGLPVINIRAVPLQSLFNRFIKRTLDIIGSIIGIIIFSPFMLIIAIVIKLTSPGKIIFAQERVGRHNKIFTMYKFRSMIEQKDEEEKKGWTTKDDKRTTAIGKIIRKISFDELPQFFNVLKGDMSLVGPRPERQQYVEKFKEVIPRYMIKHQVRPGITGYAQINGLRGDTPIDKRIEYDLWYIENWSVALDIKIMIMTVFVGFINKNAY